MKGELNMKKWIAILLCLLTLCLSLTAHAESERTVASYAYALADGSEDHYVENLIFNEDVVVSGENAKIVFSNCEFNGDIILIADEGTRVILLGCDVNGVCILRNNVREADMEYANPKFLTDTPISVVCEECVGSVVGIGDIEVTLNGEVYTMADGQLYSDGTPESGFVPYTGQEASYLIVGQWYQNDKQVVMVFCEFDPAA